MSKEDKEFLTDDIFDTENNNQNTDVDSLEENSGNTEEILWENSDVAESDISNEADNMDTVKENNEYSSQFGELNEFVDNNTTTEDNTISQKQSKPLSTKSVAIIAVIAILAVATIALGVYFLLFNNSIKSGAWIPVTIDKTTNEIVEPEDDTINQYYKFTDTDMIVYYSNSYATSESTCKITYKDNTFIMNDGTNLTINYEVSGNLIQGKLLTLTISGIEEQPITFKWSPNAKTSKLTGPEFTKNDKILGYWKHEMEGAIIYKEFTEDGITNEYAVYEGTCQNYSQMYNFDGKNLITLSPDSTNLGTEEKNEVTIDGDKLTLYLEGVPYEFTKSSKEEYEKFKESAIAGTYEYPTLDFSQYEIMTEATTEPTEAVTASATE